LTKNLEEFNCESFEVWLDFISSTLIACQDRELRGGTPLGDEETESSESSSFPIPYPRGIQVKDPAKSPPKEKRRAYPTDYQGYVPFEESSVAAGHKQVCRKGEEKEGDVPPNEAHPYHSCHRRLLPKKGEPLATPTMDLTPLSRILFSRCNAFIVGLQLCFFGHSFKFSSVLM